MRTIAPTLMAALLSVVSTAQADIIDSVGDIVLDEPPTSPDLRPDSANEADHGYGFVEQEITTFPSDFTLYDSVPDAGTWGGGGAIPNPEPVDTAGLGPLTSHLLHFDRGEADTMFVGEVLFDGEIVAIQLGSGTLSDADGVNGSDRFSYPGGLRGTEVGSEDAVRRFDDNLRVGFRLLRDEDEDSIDQIRVITRGPPNASVRLDCAGASVSYEGNVATIMVDVLNDGTERSLPVRLEAYRTPPELVMGEVYFDGSLVDCDPIDPDGSSCPLGRVPTGPTPFRAELTGVPGATVQIRAELVGYDDIAEVPPCMVELVYAAVPGDAGVDAGAGGAADAGPPPPAELQPSFAGGGGCVCGVAGARAAIRRDAWGALGVLGLLGLVVARRRFR